MEQQSGVYGTFDENLDVITTAYGVTARTVPEGLALSGAEDQVRQARETVSVLKTWQKQGETLDKNAVSRAIDLVADGRAADAERMVSDVIAITSSGKPVKARSIGQRQYVEAIRNNTVVFCVGPAGTGKTYLAMAMAVIALKNKQVSRIVLTRPAVEAGESLGFLPGDLQNKVDPYLRPLYDALYDFMGAEAYQKLQEKGAVEVAPLAYMRGRTLNDAFIILDEAQNCTNEQMKMFLTRFGEGSKVVVTGDLTQIDLPRERASGLRRAIDILGGIDQISVRHLTHKDVVRHPIVRRIVKAYDNYEAGRAKSHR
ncbi:MAG: phosphate starvation-inducible protein PhoH [Clostridia bacterium]|nr:phosphate starvation-inducible protein PhoH [Clostridia bacterium]